MAGFNFSKVSVAITANTGGLASGLTRARNLLAKFGGVAARMPSLLGGIGATVGKLPSKLPLAVGFLALAKAVQLVGYAIRKTWGWINKAAQAAASFAEQQNRVNVVFGESAAAVTQFAKAGNAIGYADTQALQAAGTFGTLFKNVGATDAAAAEMSMSLVGLSADMASFNEVKIEDSLRAMRSALVGEIEPIRRMGIMLNDAALRQEAFNMGLTDTVKRVLTPTQKMMAAYSSIVKQAAIQTGDFARTSGTLSNQQRIATSHIKDLTRELGEKLAPAFLTVVASFNNAIPSIKAFGATLFAVISDYLSVIGIAIDNTDMFSAAIRFLGGYLVALRGGWKLVAGAILTFVQALSFAGAGIWEFLVIIADITSHIAWGIERIARFIASGVVFGIKAVLSGLAAIAEYFAKVQLAKGLRSQVEDLTKLQKQILENDSGLFEGMQRNLVDPIREVAAQGFRNADALGERAAEAFASGLEDIKKPFEIFDDAKFRMDVEGVIKGMIPIAGEAGQEFGKWVNKEAKNLSSVVNQIKDLKAITVDSAAGEEFRNAILRGLDPRTAANTDRQIEENTRRGAAAAEAIPAAFGSILSDQLKLAKVAV